MSLPTRSLLKGSQALVAYCSVAISFRRPLARQASTTAFSLVRRGASLLHACPAHRVASALAMAPCIPVTLACMVTLQVKRIQAPAVSVLRGRSILSPVRLCKVASFVLLALPHLLQAQAILRRAPLAIRASLLAASGWLSARPAHPEASIRLRDLQAQGLVFSVL